MKGMALLQSTEGSTQMGEGEGENKEVVEDADVLGEL
jgi:hypothetical protein